MLSAYRNSYELRRWKGRASVEAPAAGLHSRKLTATGPAPAALPGSCPAPTSPSSRTARLLPRPALPAQLEAAGIADPGRGRTLLRPCTLPSRRAPSWPACPVNSERLAELCRNPGRPSRFPLAALSGARHSTDRLPGAVARAGR